MKSIPTFFWENRKAIIWRSKKESGTKYLHHTGGQNFIYLVGGHIGISKIEAQKVYRSLEVM